MRSIAASDDGQYCGNPQALELADERSALLIVRDVPSRRAALENLPLDSPASRSKSLAARFKELQAAGVCRLGLAVIV